MATIDYTKDLTAIGVGVVRIVAKKQDAKKLKEALEKDPNAKPPDPLHSYSDIAALVGVGGGLALQIFMPKYGKYGESVRLASWPLLTTAVYNSVVEDKERISGRVGAASGAGSPVTIFSPRRQATVGAGQVRMQVARNYMPSFDDVQAW